MGWNRPLRCPSGTRRDRDKDGRDRPQKAESQSEKRRQCRADRPQVGTLGVKRETFYPYGNDDTFHTRLVDDTRSVTGLTTSVYHVFCLLRGARGKAPLLSSLSTGCVCVSGSPRPSTTGGTFPATRPSISCSSPDRTFRGPVRTTNTPDLRCRSHVGRALDPRVSEVDFHDTSG